MLGWLKSWFGSKAPERDYQLAVKPPPGVQRPGSPAETSDTEPRSVIGEEQGAFLGDLILPRPDVDL